MRDFSRSLIIFCLALIGTIYTQAQTTVTLEPSADASLLWKTNDANWANNNYGSNQLFRAETWTSSGALYKVRSLLQFDFSEIPANAIITSAELFLYNPDDPVWTWEYHSLGNSQSTLKQVIQSWGETTVTWNNFDPTTSVSQYFDVIAIPAATTSYQDYVVDVKDMVQDWVSGEEDNYGFYFSLDTESSYRKLLFASSDYWNTSKRPKLIINYTMNILDVEGFESDNSKWENIDGDQLEWTRDINGTPSNNTGPSSASEGTYYTYIEASGLSYPSKTAYLSSPNYYLSGSSNAAINFDYHMYGAAMGTLSLEISIIGVNNWIPIWSKTGDQGNKWHKAEIDLSSYTSNDVSLRFKGVTGSSYTSDMALDNITVVAIKTAFPSSNENYILTTTAMSKYGLFGPSQQSVQYFDGLGRLSQDVQVFASPQFCDIVKPVVYDEFGRVARNYLAFPSENINGNNGVFRDYEASGDDVLGEQESFYQDHFDMGSNDPYAYSRTVYEASPLNRVLKPGAPGDSWQPEEELPGSGDHVQILEYNSNVLNEVRLFSVNTSTGLLENSPDHFAANELYKNSFYDEEDNLTQEFKNKSGQVVLKRSWEASVKYSSYYVYDNFGLLRYVLPPKAMGDIEAPSPTNQGLLCYYYKYDYRKRMIEKRLPGSAPVYMVYDDRDRLVLTQDRNLREEDQWLFTKYDKLNRPIMTGLYTDTISTHQTQEDMQVYIDRQFLLGICDFYEEASTNNSIYYTENAFPKQSDGSGYQVYTLNFYDDYDFMSVVTGFSSLDFNQTDNIDDYTDNDQVNNGYFDRVNGLVTGSKTLVLDEDEDNWALAVVYYDDHYRSIQSQLTLYPTGTSMISTKYDFVGKVLETTEIQLVNTEENSIHQDFEYDHAGRLINTYMIINTEDPVLLSQMKYNDLGELEEKNLHAEVSNYTNFQQSIDYSYNIRGWLTKINDPDDMSIDNDYFGMELYYEKYNGNILNSPLYNGNISAVIWAHDAIINNKAYVYEYDDLNRLTNANYHTKGGSIWYDFDSYDTHYNYDYNGNITLLQRRDENGIMADGLVYTYSGNQLTSVADMEDINSLYCDRNINTLFEYDYNGNMTKEQDKGLFIDYNYLNLPEKVYKYGSPPDQILYIYDAAGTKWLKKYSYNYSSVKNTMYAGAFIYEDENGTNDYSLDYLLNAEGMIEMDGTTFVDYKYFLKDHLGNTRTVFSGDGSDPIQKPDYYPFGMSFANTQGGDIKYLYNGKEMQDDIIGGINLDWYDYGFRFYDPEIGRWHVMDPLADDDKYIHLSPYNYVANNPIFFIDPDGKGIFPSLDAFMSALEAGLTNSNVQRSEHGTYCNRYAVLIMNKANDKSFGDYETLAKTANGIGNDLRNNGQYTPLSQEDALWYARQGVTVIASYVSDGSESGHLAIVSPEDNLKESGMQGGKVVSVYNMGTKVKHGTLGETFGERKVKLFISKKDKEEIDNRLYKGQGSNIGEVKVVAKGPPKLKSISEFGSKSSYNSFNSGKYNQSNADKNYSDDFLKWWHGDK